MGGYFNKLFCISFEGTSVHDYDSIEVGYGAFAYYLGLAKGMPYLLRCLTSDDWNVHIRRQLTYAFIRQNLLDVLIDEGTS